MSRYRRVSVRVWTDRFFSGLSDDGKLVWLYLLTSPQTTPFGLYRLSMDQAAVDLGWDVDRYRKAMREIVAKGGDLTVRYDANRGLVFLPKWLTYNPPNNPNVVKSWAKQIRELPEDSPLTYDWLCHMETYMRAKGFQDSFWESFGDSAPKHQEQEQDQDKGAGKPPPLRFNYNTGKWNRKPTDQEYAVWKSAYPDIEHKREMLKATAWLMAHADHPKKRFPAFLNNWMARAQRGWGDK